VALGGKGLNYKIRQRQRGRTRERKNGFSFSRAIFWSRHSDCIP